MTKGRKHSIAKGSRTRRVQPPGAAPASRNGKEDEASDNGYAAELCACAPISQLALDTDGQVLAANSLAAALLRRGLQEIVHRSFADWITPTLRNSFHAHLHRCLAGEQGTTIEVELRLDDGTKLPVRLASKALPARTASAETLFITALIDLSERALWKRRTATITKAAADSQREELTAVNHDFVEQRLQARTAELEAAKALFEEEIAERRQLEGQLLEIGERERRRIGQDLHDGLGQQITGIIFHAHLLHKHLAQKGASEAESAAQIVALLDQAKVQARQIARGLQPLDPAPQGLMNGLAHFATVTSDLYQVDCRFHCPEPILVGNRVAASHLFRITQEAVANAFRHGKARTIDIRLHQNKGTLVLEIVDDGGGLARGARRHNGLGLRFMEYRAQTIGGTLIIRSLGRGRKGTLVRCTAPVSNTLPANPEE